MDQWEALYIFEIIKQQDCNLVVNHTLFYDQNMRLTPRF